MVKSMVLPCGGLLDVCLHQQHLKMMPNLRFLDIHSNTQSSCKITHVQKDAVWSLPSLLKWFRWSYCTWDSIPTNFYHKGLVYLEISNVKIKLAWSVGPQDKNELFQKLKVLNLRLSCHLSKSPNFSWFPCLEKLDLYCCESLTILDESIGHLSQLKSLNLGACKGIMELPKSTGNLTSLVELDLSFTMIKELPHYICMLSSLRKLWLDGCPLLKKLPEFVGHLKNLVELSLNGSMRSHFEGIKEFPNSVGELENLKVLSASSCLGPVKLPRSMERMRCLHTLDLARTTISEFPDDFSRLPNLEELKMNGNMKSFPADLSHFKKLMILELSNCMLLEELPEFPSSLVELQCHHCDSLLRTFNISRLQNLMYLQLTCCKLLEELPEVSSSLVELKCHGCNSLVRTANISRLENLKHLKLTGCEKLEEIPGLEGTISLHFLEVGRCPNLIDTKRNRHGQGMLLLPEKTRRRDYHALDWADGKGLILCLVFSFKDCTLAEEGQLVTVDFKIHATIHQKDKATECKHMVRFKDVEFTSRRDTICLHHFKGFDWLGIPLHGKDSIVINDIQGYAFQPHVDHIEVYSFQPSVHLNPSERKPHGPLRVIFWELLFEDEGPGLQKPIDPDLMVANFFSWYTEQPKKKKKMESGFTTMELVNAESCDMVAKPSPAGGTLQVTSFGSPRETP